MHTNTEYRRWQRRLLYPLALSAWALALPALAAPTTTYKIVPLTSIIPVYGIGINGKGQVAYTASPASGNFARFYDGNTQYPIGGVDADVQAVNNLGQVAGSYAGHAFRWSLATGLVDINSPVASQSGSFDINEKGHIAGEAVFDAVAYDSHGFLWTPATGMRDLGSLGGRSRVWALNNADTAVGFSRRRPQDTNSSNVAVRWTAATGMRPIGTLPSSDTIANDVNDAEQIVGTSPMVPGGAPHAFLWSPRGGLRDLGTGRGARSFATRINDKGMVIGTHDGGSLPAERGFVWTRGHGLVEIGRDFPEPERSNANAVNNQGQVVGALDFRAYVWTRATGPVDLNTLVRDAPPDLVLNEGRAISDNGSIVAMSNAGLVLLVPQAAAPHEAPVIGPIRFGGSPRVGNLLSFSAAFTDTDRNDTHKASWSWGDGSEDAGAVSEKPGNGNVSAQHVYRKAGIYTVRLSVTDSGGKTSTVQRSVVVCGNGAWIAGEGWLMSPPGAAIDAQARQGVSTFALLSPAGGAMDQAAFRFDAPGLSLRSERVESLQTDGARLRYQGSATVNGVAGHRFEVSATVASRTGAAERLRLRVWHRDARTQAEVLVYDNGKADSGGAGSAVADGSITASPGD
jgi:probable HAF family extracellular repeat protein